MWKNVFLESCLLSALIFGGFYLNTVYLKNEISQTQEQIQKGAGAGKLAHISGNASDSEKNPANSAHLCGNQSPVEILSPISGADQPPQPSPEKPAESQ